MDDDDMHAMAAAKMAQEQGKHIFLESIFQFKSKNPGGSFEKFLEEIWPADFEVFERTRASEPGFTRNYDSWREQFQEVSMEGFVCPHCHASFPSAAGLLDHAEVCWAAAFV